MLDKKSLKILKAMYERYEITAEEFDQLFPDRRAITENIAATNLVNRNLLERYFENSVKHYRITFEGRAVVEERRHTALLFWLPYSITTAIAILSLICSLIN